MRIGIDIDGVIADTFPFLIDELNNYFQANLNLEDINDYNIFKVYGLSDIEALKFIHEKEQDLIERPPLKDNAAKYLNILSQEHTIYIVSARHEKYRSQTENWFQKHNIPFHVLTLLGSHDKREVCNQMSIEIFIEDNLKNIHQINSCGIPALLFDAPYNQGKLPFLTRRCYSWEEIFQVLKQWDLDGEKGQLLLSKKIGMEK